MGFLGLFGRKQQQPPPPEPEVKPKKRVILMNEEFYQRMAALAEKRRHGTTVPGLIGAALMLADLADRMEADGNRLAFVDKDGKVLRYVRV